jgi:hypothetical protein
MRQSGISSMTKGITVKRQFHVRRGRSNRRLVRAGAKPKVTIGQVPRISRLMALAIRFEQLIRDGVVADQAELARLGRVSRARLTQIMNLLNLAPDIQEELFKLQPSGRRRDQLSERWLRHVAAEADWRKQRQMWFGIAQHPGDPIDAVSTCQARRRPSIQRSGQS